MELGPCSIHGAPKAGSNGTEWNPYSWNNKANLFFLDQVSGLHSRDKHIYLIILSILSRTYLVTILFEHLFTGRL